MKKARIVFEVAVIVLIVGISVTIFVFREQLQNIGEVGYLGLFVLCFLANATVLLPAPGLMIAASCALIMNPLLVALVAALGTTAGELIGYVFGTVTEDISPKFRLLLDKITSHIHNDVIIVFVFAVLPLPLFDFVGIYSGGTKMNLLKFILACFLGKFIKMMFYTHAYSILDWASQYLPILKEIT